MEKEPTLICIPDISGFTQFMSEVDFEMSSKIIPSLLNKIIYSNEIGFKISEIEGDAVLFYRTGDLPPFKTLIEQCKLFYTDFYNQMDVLIAENSHKLKSHIIPKILGLKIVLHFGVDIGKTQVGNNIKLIGEDIIIAHRLLKNSIESDEYLMISEGVLNQYKNHDLKKETFWTSLKSGHDNYEHIGQVNYSYFELNPLKE
ncbi:DUF2652 domain-containing protein [Hwangdonia lutea]|uniref:DUF2652 domain-containing protein n=1 Tax=Hwangdonia lutea TaxID=3075823 RepID=A0AA97ER41_9FLAO|nr:DUF2652 domain-containing protein [Hwangdonia sp. SCSIO 19198]WOD44528.1 DUF2652 domain-containing protein [Hwangdonia sp. SCSIO 19198]